MRRRLRCFNNKDSNINCGQLNEKVGKILENNEKELSLSVRDRIIFIYFQSSYFPISAENEKKIISLNFRF